MQPPASERTPEGAPTADRSEIESADRSLDTGTEPRPPPESLLSVVIVTYNEADRIRACLESVVDATRDRAVEIVLVDGGSTDATVEIASAFPITILQVPDALRTPGAGRYVGTAATTGEFVLFVDGDMVLERPWLESALETVRRPGVAAVDGQLNEPGETARTVDAVRGVALYRRSRLEAVGGFDPYLNSLEDIHLGFELRAAGDTLVRLPAVAGEHPPSETVGEPFRRLRRGYTLGPGQALRRSIGSPPLFGAHCYRLRHRLIVLAWLVLGAVSILARAAFAVWLACSTVAAGVLIAKRGLRGGIAFLLSKGLGIGGLLVGALRALPERETFPLDRIELIQSGSIQPPGCPEGASDSPPRSADDDREAS